MFYKLYKDGLLYGGVVLLVSVICLFFHLVGLAIFLCLLAMFIINFFRMPVFSPPADDGNILSPAWGKVTSVETNSFEGKEYINISIFLSVFDVHFQCAPCSGTVKSVEYKKGRFLNALKPESSDVNEKNTIQIKRNDSDEIIEVTQIAGLIARRIKCWPKKGDELLAGGYYGLIKFGSRVDVKFPASYRVIVKPGDKVSGGTTILAQSKASVDSEKC